MTFQSTGNNGLLWRALAISIAVHALLLSPQHAPRLIERAGAVLHATLRPLAAVAPAPVASAAAPGRPPPAAPASARAEQHSAPAPSALAVLPAPTSAAAGIGGSDTARQAGTAGVAAGPSRVLAAVPATVGAGAAPGAGAGIDADGLRQFRLALAREARRFKRYPERAMRAGIGGTVEVRIEIAADGGVQGAHLAGTSGNDSLDAAAVAMVRQAAPRAMLPETLRGRAFPVTLPVIFDPDAE